VDISFLRDPRLHCRGQRIRKAERHRAVAPRDRGARRHDCFRGHFCSSRPAASLGRRRNTTTQSPIWLPCVWDIALARHLKLAPLDRGARHSLSWFQLGARRMLPWIRNGVWTLLQRSGQCAGVARLEKSSEAVQDGQQRLAKHGTRLTSIISSEGIG